ncbi:MAG: arsenical pump-driving ATPase [Eggerthellaceae bacterium]|jgi:arsenite-transporting ATPase|nr:arsenical pump-driving ATPase [Eggerthellaceae bacterium]
MDTFDIKALEPYKYLFFTGKGGVGKTSVSCSAAVAFADAGERVLIVSTDPASNMQDVFETEISEEGTVIEGCPNLTVMDIDPLKAAAAYRENVVGPYRGVLPDDAIANIEEQLSGSCTIEIAAFDRFAWALTDEDIAAKYDRIVFDTAPTGHTLRTLELPSAWTNYLDENSTGTSCLGQLSGLGEKRDTYAKAVDTLADEESTLMALVARPQTPTLLEAARSREELAAFGIVCQILIVNGVLEGATDQASEKMLAAQQAALANMPEGLEGLKMYRIPLRSYNVTGLGFLRSFFIDGNEQRDAGDIECPDVHSLSDLVDELAKNGIRVVFTMGKGGVGKTSVAVGIAKGLAERGKKVRLTTTDPADHLGNYDLDAKGVTISHIDEKHELEDYKAEVLAAARKTMGNEDFAYIQESLRSPCTQEIAVFRAFANIVEKADDEVVVIDTAPTGHTLLLLESTQSYSDQIKSTGGEVPESVKKLLPRLHDPAQAEVVIVTLPEATPVYEAERLREDLNRTGIENRWWVVNQCLSLIDVTDPVLRARAASEKKWFGRIGQMSGGLTVGIPWNASGDVK